MALTLALHAAPADGHFVNLTGDSMTFAFSTPIQAFGAYISGMQLAGQTVTFSDGSSQSIPVPFSDNGGIAFVGFTDAGQSGETGVPD